MRIIKAILLPKIIYPSSFLSTPTTVIKEFNALVFNFLWNGKDKVIRRSTYAPYDSGGLKIDVECCGFWKHYLNYLLSNKGGLFFLECNYDVKQIYDVMPIFYYELLSWWAELRETVDPDRGHEYILWNNKKILIEGKTVFYRHYFDNGVIFTKDLLFDMTNTDSFRAMKEQDLTNSNFLVWTGLRQSVPSNYVL